MKKSFNVAVVGATGVVGSTLLSILTERHFPVKKIFLLASQRSVGERRDYQGQSLPMENIATFDFSQTQICFFCAGNDISAEYVAKATALGNVVIDKSSYFRYHTEVPLVIPEVNEAALAGFRRMNIIASPNCSTIPIVMALKPIYDAVGITRINVATYQSVSGTGKEAIAELTQQTTQILNAEPIHPAVYPQQIAFNILPHCDDFQENGYTKEEMKIIWEVHKILNDDTIAVNPTAVRVPVFYGHSAAVHIETKQKLSANVAEQLLMKAPGVKLSTGKYPYATPAQDATGKDAIYIGRLREDLSHAKGLNLWVVGDNIRKGAALNGVQIAERLIESYL